MENTLKDISRFFGDFSGNLGNTPADERTFPTTVSSACIVVSGNS